MNYDILFILLILIMGTLSFGYLKAYNQQNELHTYGTKTYNMFHFGINKKGHFRKVNNEYIECTLDEHIEYLRNY